MASLALFLLDRLMPEFLGKTLLGILVTIVTLFPL
jgi:hypothetical protein